MDFKTYISSINLTKLGHKGIHFEQKTTPDLIWCVALVLLDITKDDPDLVFNDRDDVRTSRVFNDLMQDYFTKAPQSEAEDEYNKVSSYQLGLFEYAGIIERVDERPMRYKIIRRDVLQELAINDLNASKFLTEYTEKLIRDNGLWSSFESYLRNPTQQGYMEFKEAYWRWARRNTGVRTTNPQHSYRVFNKIFNILCYKYRIPGQSASNVIDGVCPYNFLIYNRKNFRDKDKPSGMTRREYTDTILSQIDSEGVVGTLLKKAKEAVARKYEDSEVKNPEYGYLPNKGIHVHHILPVHAYREFSLVRENLIALTPGQHLSDAHPMGNTRLIDRHYQAICLLQKLNSIRESIANQEDFYEPSRFIDIVNACYGLDLGLETSLESLETIISSKVAELSS